MTKGDALLVTTEFRGVFFGYYGSEEGDSLVLTDARNCSYWSPEMRGFLGLATMGPNSDCRIGTKVNKLELRGVTSLSECSPEAVKKWEAAPWTP